MSTLTQLVTLATLLSSVLTIPHRLQTRGGQRMCGRQLSDTMSLVCGDDGFASPLDKRSGGLVDRLLMTKYQGKLDYGLDWNQGLDMFADDYQHGDETPAENKVTFGKRSGPQADVFYRNVRGIVEECCHKPCTMTQMRMYCRGSK
ncbi:hypothetical protein HDE_03206 [Halotydeus destructor]|nr:hypothetical protein HDE_03206 [Halotydeus destructor]